MTCEFEQNSTGISIGIFVCFGLVASWIPQIRAVYLDGPNGISLYYLFLGFIGAVSTVSNVVLLQSESLICCYQWTLGVCFSNILGIIQVAFGSGCFLIFMIIVSKRQDNRLLPVMICYAILCVASVIVLLTLKVYSFKVDVLQHIAAFLGLVAAIAGMFQFVPQVYHTATTKEFGNLSIVTLFMQAPGSFLFSFSLALQPGTNWTSWISYAVCGSLQLVLIFLYFVLPRQVAVEEEEPLLEENST